MTLSARSQIIAENAPEHMPLFYELNSDTLTKVVTFSSFLLSGNIQAPSYTKEILQMTDGEGMFFNPNNAMANEDLRRGRRGDALFEDPEVEVRMLSPYFADGDIPPFLVLGDDPTPTIDTLRRGIEVVRSSQGDSPRFPNTTLALYALPPRGKYDPVYAELHTHAQTESVTRGRLVWIADGMSLARHDEGPHHSYPQGIERLLERETTLVGDEAIAMMERGIDMLS
jgi:hypothetical protein